MKPILYLIFFIASISISQTTDYNTKKGYAANGYDVVAYFSNKAVEGNKTFSTKFDGVSYKFENKENLETFIKNPEKYIPQYGGYCAYAVAVKSDKVAINPETFEIVDGKLYLFYNAWGTNTLELWHKENAELLEKKANENWKKIKFKK